MEQCWRKATELITGELADSLSSARSIGAPAPLNNSLERTCGIFGDGAPKRPLGTLRSALTHFEFLAQLEQRREASRLLSHSLILR